MAFLGHVFEPQPVGPASGDLTEDRRRAVGARRLAHAVAAVRRAPELGGLIGLAALLNLWALGRNGWANTYYSAAVRSMAASWHNFLYASLDPSGVMTVDKPPLSLWIQALSVRVFGYHPLAILVPEALMGVASVVLVYDLVRRRFGRLGGLVAGLALATTPIAVAMSRDNNPDALLTLCCVAAVWFAVRAFEDGRTRLPALARKIVQKQAACDRADRGHRRVIRHPRRIADGKFNQQQIVDHRKRQDGRIEKRDQEKAQTSRGGDNRLKPVRQMKFRRR